MDEKIILATTALMPSVTTVMNLVTLCRTAPTRFIPQEHHATKTDLNQGIEIPTPKGTDHTPPLMVTNMADISTDLNSSTILTMTGATGSEGTHCAPQPATTAACTALWPMDASITIHIMTHPTGIVTPHLTLITSPTHITHTLLHRPEPVSLQQPPLHCTGNTAKESQATPKTFNPCRSHHSKTVIIQDCLSDSSSDSNSNSNHLNY